MEKRTSSRLFYELDETERQKYSITQQTLTHLSQSQRIWRVEAKSATPDWKRNAGASTVVRRVPITVGRSNPPRVQTNLEVPCVNLATSNQRRSSSQEHGHEAAKRLSCSRPASRNFPGVSGIVTG